MKRLAIALVALAGPVSATSTPAHDTATSEGAGHDATNGQAAHAPMGDRSRPAPFAAKLAAWHPRPGAGYWRVPGNENPWKAIGESTSRNRQEARWAYARSMIASGRYAEAHGALSVMFADEPELAMADAFQLARGRALIGLRRYPEAIEQLGSERLSTQSEACLWRMVALGAAGLSKVAYRQWNCALPALNARHSSQQHPFLVMASASAIAAGHAEQARKWLARVPMGDQLANILRGRAAMALGDRKAARHNWLAASGGPSEPLRLSARLSVAEMALAGGEHRPEDLKKALKLADNVRYRWRGGPLEKRAVLLAYDSASELEDDVAALSTGSTLLRYHTVAHSHDILAALQGRLAAALKPGSKVPLVKAAGMFWDYRDLTPAGAAGDLMVSNFATRLQNAGLYRRAADLLYHQLNTRVEGITKGPLSVRVATLFIMANDPKQAIKLLRETDGIPFPEEMRRDRQRIEAVAVANVGRPDEALAILDTIPGSEAIAAEIQWRRQNWKALATSPERILPTGNARLSAGEQTQVLRLAVAYVMVGNETGLSSLRLTYGDAFATLPSGEAFAALTGPVAERDPAKLAEALSQMPGASPAGSYGDLLAATGAG